MICDALSKLYDASYMMQDAIVTFDAPEIAFTCDAWGILLALRCIIHGALILIAFCIVVNISCIFKMHPALYMIQPARCMIDPSLCMMDPTLWKIHLVFCFMHVASCIINYSCVMIQNCIHMWFIYDASCCMIYDS